VGSVAPHRFFLLSFPGIRDHLVLNAPEDHTAVERAPSSLRFAGAVHNAARYLPRPNRQGDQLALELSRKTRKARAINKALG